MSSVACGNTGKSVNVKGINYHVEVSCTGRDNYCSP